MLLKLWLIYVCTWTSAEDPAAVPAMHSWRCWEKSRTQSLKRNQQKPIIKYLSEVISALKCKMRIVSHTNALETTNNSTSTSPLLFLSICSVHTEHHLLSFFLFSSDRCCLWADLSPWIFMSNQRGCIPKNLTKCTARLQRFYMYV